MKNLIDYTIKKQQKGFPQGQSGNPAGRPRGSLNKATMLVQNLLEEDAEAITRKLVEKARNGDMSAIKLVMERIAPPRRDVAVVGIFDLDNDSMNSTEDINRLTLDLLHQMNLGILTPAEAKTIADILHGHRKALEVIELQNKLDTIEMIVTKGKSDA